MHKQNHLRHLLNKCRLNGLAVMLIIFFFLPLNAFSATFTVNAIADAIDVNLGDGICATAAGQCTLRAAIMEANASAGIPDTINLNDGIYALSISGSLEDLSRTGDLDITDSVIINGNAADKTAVVVDAGGAYSGGRDRVFHIVTSEAITVEFNYLVIKGGYSDDTRGGGGGICVNCVASDSEAYQPTGLGSMTPDINTTFAPPVNYFGGAGTSRPIVTLRFVDVIDNYDVVSGAGIMNSGVLTIEDSVFRNNITSFRAGDARQGVFNATNSQFVGGGNGGAISNWGGKLTIRRSILTQIPHKPVVRFTVKQFLHSFATSKCLLKIRKSQTTSLLWAVEYLMSQAIGISPVERRSATV